jgi:hypothetical protein
MKYLLGCFFGVIFGFLCFILGYSSGFDVGARFLELKYDAFLDIADIKQFPYLWEGSSPCEPDSEINQNSDEK